MQFLATYNELMTIQRAQIAYYRQSLGLKGLRQLRKETIPSPFDPNEKRKISELNRLIPRGGSIEAIISTLPRPYPKSIDPTNKAYHDAIRKGIM